MFSPSQLLITALLGAASVMGHGHVTGAIYKGQSVQGFTLSMAYSNNPPAVIGWSTNALDNGFIEPSQYSTSDIACHKSAKPGKAHLVVESGDELSLVWDTWPESHKGPVIDYLAKCDGPCENADPSDLEFFKIAETGMIDRSRNNGFWASDQIIDNDFQWQIKIPNNLAPGNYVLRHELIALHASFSENGAQNYPQCVNLVVTGNGSSNPKGVKAATLYKSSDSGILFDLYSRPSTYPIPGPDLIAGAQQATQGIKPVTGTLAPATGSDAPTTQAPTTTTSAAEEQVTAPPASNGDDEEQSGPRTVTVTATVECDANGNPRLY